jgi:Zn-dependent protease with chaperone function
MARLTREEFAAMVQKFEKEAEKNPSGYRTRVGLFAALGYGFIVFLLLLSLGVVALLIVAMISSKRIGAGGFKLLIAAGIFAFVLLRAMWVRFEKPEGIPLTRDNAPCLYETVDKMTDALDAPRFHHILLTNDFNAFVAQRPRLGIFGWQVNYLCLGLPLMQSLSTEQFEAVIAHELGHLRGGHGRFGGWIYRVNVTWEQLLSRLEGQGAGNILGAFFNWYAPRFAAYSFALRRGDEYEADACAARLTSARTAADALCLLPVQNQIMDKGYWEPLKKSVVTQSTPPARVFTDLIAFLRSGPAPIPATAGGYSGPMDEAGSSLPATNAISPDRALHEALIMETSTGDTHPALSDRLKALKQEPRVPEIPAVTAADYFIGPAIPRFADQMDKEWRENIEPLWKMRYEEAQQEKAQLEELNRKAAAGELLSDEEAWKRADWTEDFYGEDAALPLMHELLTRPDLKVRATFTIGRILILRDDAEGVTYLEKAVALEQRVTLPALGLLYDYYKRQGKEEKAKAVYTQGMRHADAEDDAEMERASAGDRRSRYLPHVLTLDTVAQLRAVVAANPEIAEAYLVRKAVKHFPERPFFVLGVTLTNAWRRMNTEEDGRKAAYDVAERLGSEAKFKEETIVVCLNTAELKWLQKPMKDVPGSLIYSRDGK